MHEVPTGLYVHVPFCARTCDYCAFYQSAPTADEIRRYLEGIEKEASLLEWPARIDTVFWGGGTPGILAAKDLRHLGRIVNGRCGAKPREWSVEMTPLSVTKARLEALREVGVTRVSLGVQSFQAPLLSSLGREHTPEQTYRAYERLRAAGFDNINFDLMFALPGQSDMEWERDLNEAIRLRPEHISTYCLTFEEDTKLWLQLSKGKLRRDIEAEARLYEWTWGRLAQAGYAQYEVSNFSLPGRACIHNLNTWRMHDWIGLGPSAASQYRSQRGTNIHDLAKWMEGLASGRRATEDRLTLSAESLAEDALIFGLRMNEGVDLAPWRVRAPRAPWHLVDARLAQLAQEGLLVQTDSRVRLTNRGRMVADSVGAEFLGMFADPCPSPTRHIEHKEAKNRRSD
ncbi:MAG: radical SAM family heme chaperone HemW [Opitutaceae bacterium]|jgi:oxygen-independent coproporphyrinogen-3 oxidase